MKRIITLVVIMLAMVSVAQSQSVIDKKAQDVFDNAINDIKEYSNDTFETKSTYADNTIYYLNTNLISDEQSKDEATAILIVGGIVIGFIIRFAIFGLVCQYMALKQGRNDIAWKWAGGIFGICPMFILYCLGETEEQYQHRIIEEIKLMKKYSA